MTRKTIKYLFVILVILVVSTTVGLTYFFYANEAPITKGKISYNVTYKNNLSLDIYHPTNILYDKSPLVLFVHGGAWIAGRKESMNVNRVNGAINKLRDHGYTIISIEYTLARDKKTPFPACIVDGFDAIQWISSHADSLNLDMDNFGIMGESAGAHIAMMNTITNPADFGLSHPKLAMDYMIDIYGPSDLYRLYRSESLDSIMTMIKELPKPINQHLNLAHRVFGFDPEVDQEKTKSFADQYSPVTYLNDKIPPVLMIHGDADQVVPLDQSISLKSRLDSLGIENEIHILEGTNHAFIGADDTQKADIQRWIFDFIESRRSAKSQD
ncbi:MAG: alpha/beta hydrolase [Reichenbachiella sp.]|uniref:alpha/beta hydrolase n=1 Tax=Reichenbachiella sp. TaxID=2184521 RepID=UPI003267CC77